MTQHALVTAPALRPAKNGLIERANVVSHGDDRWENGIAFTPRGCQQIHGHVAWCPSDDKSDFHDCPPVFEAASYLLELGLQWSMMDMGADPKAILTEAMEIGTSPVLERLAWIGVQDVATGTPIVPVPVVGAVAVGGITGRIMGATAVPPSVIPPTLSATALSVGTATSIPQAIGMLEAKFLDASDHIGGGGTLIMSPVIAAQGGGAFDPDTLITRATESTVIVANTGDPDTIIGVVGEIDVHLSEVFVLEANERALNEWVGRAERRAAVSWNPCAVFSVDVS